jgi:hypothetical protein
MTLRTIRVRCTFVSAAHLRCVRDADHEPPHVFHRANTPQPATMQGATTHRPTSLESLAVAMPYGVFGPTREVPVSEEFQVQTIAKPRQVRDGSVTDAMVDAVFAAFKDDQVPKGEAVVVYRGVEKENTARNRARTLAERMKERHGEDEGYVPLAAHAIPDPAAEGKFVGAVSAKPIKPADTPAPAAAPSGDAAGTVTPSGADEVAAKRSTKS